MAYKYENWYIKYDLTPILRQNRFSLMWNKDSEKSRSNSGTKFVPVKLYLVHRRSLEKISSYFDTITLFQIFFWQLEVAVNCFCLFFLSIYNLFIIKNYYLFININSGFIIIVISLQRNFLCKHKFIDENSIICIQFSSCLFISL